MPHYDAWPRTLPSALCSLDRAESLWLLAGTPKTSTVRLGSALPFLGFGEQELGVQHKENQTEHCFVVSEIRLLCFFLALGWSKNSLWSLKIDWYANREPKSQAKPRARGGCQAGRREKNLLLFARGSVLFRVRSTLHAAHPTH